MCEVVDPASGEPVALDGSAVGELVLTNLGREDFPLLRYRTERITELGSYVILAVYAFLALRWATCFEVYADTVSGGVDLAGIQAILNTAPQ